MRAHVVLLLALVSTQAGCIENMDDLRETLGFSDPPPADPVYLPPVAKAQATATSVRVGESITFGSEGSKDPQKLPLDFNWDFGDSRIAHGPFASHAFDAAGEYRVRLMVTNLAGLTDDDVLLVTVAALDRAPTAAIRVLDAAGVAASRGTAGVALTFDAAASDPEGGPLAYDWDFGDGATSHDARPTHAYADPGHHTVRLRVTDRAGHAASAQIVLPVDATWRASGAFEPGGADRADVPLRVAAGAKTLTLGLAYDAGLGVNDLEMILRDATGAEVARTGGEGEPAAQNASRELRLDAAALAKGAPGAWTAEIVRERGLSVAWTLEAAETV